MKIVGLTKRLAGPLTTFVVGTGSLFLADILISRSLSADVVAQWASLKSVLLPLAAFALFGLDQMIVREPSKWKRIRPFIALTVVTLSAIGSAICYMFNFFERPMVLFVAGILLAGCNIYFGLFRAELRFTWAHIARDGWKFIFLIGTLALLAGITLPLDALLLATVGSVLVIVLLKHALSERKNVRELFNEVRDFRSALHVSFPFALASISLAVATYGEVSVLNALDADDKIADYFITALCFVSAITMLNTFLSTFLGTMARQHPETAVQWYDSVGAVAMTNWFLLPLAALIVPCLTFGAGWIVHAIIFPSRDLHLSWAMLMAVTAGTRLAYTFISILVGALGDRRQVARTSFAYFGLALLFPAVAFFLDSVGMETGFAVALASVLHWLGRSIVGFSTGRRILSHYRKPQASGEVG